MNVMLRFNKNVAAVFYYDILGILEKILSNIFGNCTGDGRHGADISLPAGDYHISDDWWGEIIKLNGTKRSQEFRMRANIGLKIGSIFMNSG